MNSSRMVWGIEQKGHMGGVRACAMAPCRDLMEDEMRRCRKKPRNAGTH